MYHTHEHQLKVCVCRKGSEHCWTTALSPQTNTKDVISEDQDHTLTKVYILGLKSAPICLSLCKNISKHTMGAQHQQPGSLLYYYSSYNRSGSCILKFQLWSLISQEKASIVDVRGCQVASVTSNSLLRTVAHQAPLSMGFSRQEYWSGLPFPPPRDRPNPGIEPMSPKSPALAGRVLPTAPPIPGLFNIRVSPEA